MNLAALKAYGPGRGALKRRHAPVNWHWMTDSTQIYRF